MAQGYRVVEFREILVLYERVFNAIKFYVLALRTIHIIPSRRRGTVHVATEHKPDARTVRSATRIVVNIENFELGDYGAPDLYVLSAKSFGVFEKIAQRNCLRVRRRGLRKQRGREKTGRKHEARECI